MADIELVIKIPEEMYAQIIDENGIDTMLIPYKDIIKNGVPLPNGHGRLGDLDALEKEMTNGILAGNYEEGYETFAHINDTDDCVECVKYADTIIEADKQYEVKVINRGNCMMCGKELTEGLFFCKECEAKAKQEREDKE